MERYHAFPGAGDGDTTLALQVARENVFAYAACDGVNPNVLTVIPPGKEGTWVKFDDALKRGRKEYDEGKKAANLDYQEAYDRGYHKGLSQGRADGQVKVQAISEISSHQLAAEFDRGHKAAISSRLVALIDSHQAAQTYEAALSDTQSDLAEADGAIQEVIEILESYPDVTLIGVRGPELSKRLSAWRDENKA